MSERRPSAVGGRVVFIGGSQDAAPVLDALLRSPVSVAGVVSADRTGTGPPADDVRRLLSGREIPVRRTSDPGAATTLQWMFDLRPDLLVCAGWPEVLPPTVLSLAPRGTVAVHPSLFPRQRRYSGVCWAILRGETVTGASLLALAPGPAGGDLVDQREVVIGADDTCATLGEKVARAGAGMLVDQLPRLLDGTAPRRSLPPPRRTSVLPERTPDMGVTSFDRTTSEVHDWIRAQTRPLWGAYALLRGRRVVLWRAERMAGHQTHAPPGTVLGVDEGGVVVTTRTGAIRLLEVESQASSPMPAADWFARERLAPGCAFDPVDAPTLAWALGRR